MNKKRKNNSWKRSPGEIEGVSKKLFFVLALLFVLGFFALDRFTGFAVVEGTRVTFDINESWDISGGIIRVSLNEQKIDLPLEGYVQENKAIIDIGNLDLNQSGDVFVDLLINYTVVDVGKVAYTANVEENKTIESNETVVEPELNETVIENKTIEKLPVNETVQIEQNKTEEKNQTIKEESKQVKQKFNKTEAKLILKDKRGSDLSYNWETEDRIKIRNIPKESYITLGEGFVDEIELDGLEGVEIKAGFVEDKKSPTNIIFGENLDRQSVV